MKIAIFGETGQVASELIRRVPDGITLDVHGRARAEFMMPDLVSEVARKVRADLIINAAAYTAVDRAETEPDVANTVNGASVTALAEAAAETGTPIIHVSSDYVFDGSGSAPKRPEETTAPLSAYGISKEAGEIGIRESGARHVVLRTSWVFSAHGGNFVKTMLRLGTSGNELAIVSDQVGGPTPAAAIADALYDIGRAMADGHEGGVYHFAGLPDASWADFAREIFRQAGMCASVRDIPTTEFPRPAVRPLNSRLDCSSLERDFGIGRPDWKAGLSDVLKELQA
ncbi:MAG: dTDP-4-dehydrorhamnose reductase [Silicimonas sp.]